MIAFFHFLTDSMVYTRCSTAAWCGFNSRELNFHIWSHHRRNGQGPPLWSKVKRNRRSIPKTFQAGLLQNWQRICAFDMPFQCMHAKPRCKMSHSVARHQLGASQQHYPSYSLSLFTMNVANQFYHPCECKAIAEMCKERITHTELNTHQSNLKIDFLLLSRTLPVSVAYKTTEWYVKLIEVFMFRTSNFIISFAYSVFFAVMLLADLDLFVFTNIFSWFIQSKQVFYHLYIGIMYLTTFRIKL